MTEALLIKVQTEIRLDEKSKTKKRGKSQWLKLRVKKNHVKYPVKTRKGRKMKGRQDKE